MAQPWTRAERLRYVTVKTPGRWTRGEEAAIAVVGPDDAYPMLVINDVRRDRWIWSLLRKEGA